jgi:hypothetical protein
MATQTLTHTQLPNVSVFAYGGFFFEHFYGFILSLKPLNFRSLTIGNTHKRASTKKKKIPLWKSATMSGSEK